MRAVDFCTTHGQNKTRRFDTEGFCHLAVCAAQLFHSTHLPSVLLVEPEICDQSCTLVKNIYISQIHVRAPKNECMIVCNVCHVNST